MGIQHQIIPHDHTRHSVTARNQETVTRNQKRPAPMVTPVTHDGPTIIYPECIGRCELSIDQLQGLACGDTVLVPTHVDGSRVAITMDAKAREFINASLRRDRAAYMREYRKRQKSAS